MRAPHRVSFKHAWNGVKHAFDSQPNFRFHVLIFTLVIISGIYLKIDVLAFVVIFLAASIVFSMEMLNTALEALSDEVADGKYKDLIKVAKDVAAGGVLISAIFAVLIGLIVFIPYLL